MRVLVTGATGFIGRHTTQRLLAAGHEVDALARPTSHAWKRKTLAEAGARLVDGDVTEPQDLRRSMDGVDAVVHTAALVRLGKVDEQAMHRTNVLGTENVMRAARDAAVARVLHVSSIAAIGFSGDADADEETQHPGTYKSSYERSKHLSARVAAEHAAAGMNVIQALPSIVFGRGDPNFGVFFRTYVRGRIRVLPGPDTVLSFVHVDDLARGLVLALEKGARGDRFLFTQQNITLEDLFARLERATGIPAPRLRIPAAPARAMVKAAAVLAHVTPWRGWLRSTSGDILGRRRAYRNDRARQVLGWEPGDFDARLTDTAQYYAAKYGPPPVRRRLAHVLEPAAERPRVEVAR